MLRRGDISKEEYEILAESLAPADPLMMAKQKLERGEIDQEEYEIIAQSMAVDPLEKVKAMLQRGEISKEEYDGLAAQLGGGGGGDGGSGGGWMQKEWQAKPDKKIVSTFLELEETKMSEQTGELNANNKGKDEMSEKLQALQRLTHELLTDKKAANRQQQQQPQQEKKKEKKEEDDWTPPPYLPWSTGVNCYFQATRLKVNVDDGMGGYMDARGSQVIVSASGTSYVLVKNLAGCTGRVKGEARLAYVIKENPDGGGSWCVDTEQEPWKRAIKMWEMPSVRDNAVDAQREVEIVIHCTIPIHCTHTLYPYTVLTHYIHTLYSHYTPHTVLIHCAHTLYSHTIRHTLYYMHTQVELSALISSPCHGNVCRFYECALDQYMMCLVLDFCDDGELFDHVAAGSFGGDVPQVKKCFRQIMEGLRHLHRHNISHMDMNVGDSNTLHYTHTLYSHTIRIHCTHMDMKV
jgi:hypothetical protein